MDKITLKDTMKVSKIPFLFCVLSVLCVIGCVITAIVGLFIAQYTTYDIAITLGSVLIILCVLANIFKEAYITTFESVAKGIVNERSLYL